MNIWKSIVLIVASLVFLLLSGCLAQQPPIAETRNFTDSMTENILIAMNEDSYSQFSQDFDEQMRTAMTESQYKKTILPIKTKIGSYISKEFVSAENKDGYVVVTYKVKFSLDPEVTVRTVFSGKDGKKYVAGFWLDSPKLR